MRSVRVQLHIGIYVTAIIDAYEFSEDNTDSKPEQYLENQVREGTYFPSNSKISRYEYKTIYAYERDTS